jgi:hypothetical protein
VGSEGGHGVTIATVKVPDAALEVARTVGITRANYAFSRDLKNFGNDLLQSEQMANHIRGARCERAVEHYTGLPWHPAVGMLGGPDVGENIQVRSRPYPPGGDLAFRPARDADHHPFVLVWDCGDEFLILGWLWGYECRASSARLFPAGYKYVPPPYRDIATLTGELNYEVEECPLKLWEEAILQGYGVFRHVRANNGGIVTGNRASRRIEYKSLQGK